MAESSLDAVARWRALSPPSYLNPYDAAALGVICVGDVEDAKRKLKYLRIEGQDLCDLGLKKFWIGDDKQEEDDQMGGTLVAGNVVLSFDSPATSPVRDVVSSILADKEERIAELERLNSGLCHFAAQHTPYKQFLRTALAFLVFFSAVLTIQLFSGIWMIAPALAWVGMALGASAVVLSYLAALDWRDWRSRRDSCSE